MTLAVLSAGLVLPVLAATGGVAATPSTPTASTTTGPTSAPTSSPTSTIVPCPGPTALPPVVAVVTSTSVTVQYHGFDAASCGVLAGIPTLTLWAAGAATTDPPVAVVVGSDGQPSGALTATGL